MPPSDPPCLLIAGAGSWGTALAIAVARHGHRVLLWSHEADAVSRMTADRCNREFLPDTPFPSTLLPQADLHKGLALADEVLVAVPSFAFRDVLTAIARCPTRPERLAWATKGLEEGSAGLLHEVAAEVLGDNTPLAVVSGPTFAAEVAAGLPTALTVAATDDSFAEDLAGLLRSDTLRPYTSRDMIGVALGGAVKNVLAIAAGISDGLGFGANGRAALITRGLAELMRLGQAMGGDMQTLMGLAGVGDLVLTCTDDQSRNRRFGKAIGRGTPATQALQDIGQVVEGMQTAREIMRLARRHQVEMPICAQVYAVLFDGVPADQAVHALLTREPRTER